MKVLFIYPDIRTRGSSRHLSAGLGYLSAVLKEKGHQTGLIYWCGEPVYIIKKKIKAFSPDIIAFSAMTTQFKHVIRLAESLVNEIDSISICGGAHVTLEPQSLEGAPLHGICRGEGEEALLELLENIAGSRDLNKIKNFWWKKNGEIYRNSLRPVLKDLDSLPFPDRDIFNYQTIIDSDFGQASFIFSRGCPFNCSYCSNHAFRRLYGEPYVRFRSINKSLAEIDLVASEYHFSTIVFDDDTMSLNKNWFKNFLTEYHKHFHYPFDLNMRVEAVDSDIFPLLKESGCRKVSIGVECGNEKLRREVLQRPMTNQAILKCFKDATVAGLKTKSFNLIGFPGENKETFMDTVRLNQAISPSSLILNIFYPYPGTDLYELCRKNGYIGEEAGNFRERDDTILNLPGFHRKEIMALYRRFGYLVYLHTNFWKSLLYLIRYSTLSEPFLKLLDRRLTIGRYMKQFIKVLSGA